MKCVVEKLIKIVNPMNCALKLIFDFDFDLDFFSFLSYTKQGLIYKEQK